MKLKYKLLLPTLIQAALIAILLVYMASAGSSLLNSLESETTLINRTSEQLNQLIDKTNKFFLSKVSQKDFSEEVKKTLNMLKTQQSFEATEIVRGVVIIQMNIQKADGLQRQNNQFIEQILKLTERSMEQSNGYIKLTVQNLVDPKKKNQVSVMERMVILGASANTNANMKIQILVYQMLKDFSKKEELSRFLKILLENAEKDIVNLKDTPFARMPIAAKNANLEVGERINQYISNIESITAIENSIQQQTTSLQKALRNIELRSMESTFGDISDLGFMLATFLIVLSLFLIVIGFISARTITSPMLMLRNWVTGVVSEGDFSGQIENSRTDEIGETVDALNTLIKSLYDSISDINSVMEAVDKGDFSVRVTRQHKGDLNHLKMSINSSVESLSRTMNQVVHSSQQINTGSTELSASSHSLASGTSQQAASLEEISSSMDELKSQSTTNNGNAIQASDLSSQTIDIVERGNRQMEDMLTSMDQINNTSTDVSKIIKVIDEIAFQTNLLALNAAVEAARAGKYGKGFAVVAEEVRNLAARSAEAARSSTEMIEKSGKEVEKGVDNAGKTAAILNEINESITKVNGLVAEIATASREQTIGIDEVNKGLSQINSVVQQNSSISEETASASEELNGQALELERMMRQFTLDQSQPENPLKDQEVVQNPEPHTQSLRVVPQLEKPDTNATSPKTITLDDDEFGKY